MADTGNIFDNSGNIPAVLGGQGAGPAADGNLNTAAPAPDAGQAAQTVTVTDPAHGTGDPGTQPTATPTNWNTEFKTPEDMYAAYQKLNQSYNNIRPAFTKATTELSQLRKAATDGDNHTGLQQAAQQGQVNPVELLLGKVQEIVAPVREQNEELMMRTTLSQLASDNPDTFTAVAPMMNEILKQNPKLWDTAAPSETAFELAQARYIKQNMAQMLAAAKQGAYADKDLKVLNGGTKTQVHTPPQTLNEADSIKAGILGVISHGKHIF